MTNSQSAFTPGNVKLIILASFLLLLSFIFRDALVHMMSKGCFELSLGIADTGVELSDQSLCTAENFEDVSKDLFAAGARSVKEQADSLFDKYEEEIYMLTEQNQRLLAVVEESASKQEKSQETLIDFANMLAQIASRSNASADVRRLNSMHQEMFGDVAQIEIVRIEEPVMQQAEVMQINKTIRADFQRDTKQRVDKVNKSIEVKRR